MLPGFLLTWMALSLALYGCGSADDNQPRLYLRGAAVLTLLDEEPLVGHAVIVRGERIEAVETERTQIPPEWTVLDLDGLTLLPGFIDNHVHVATDTVDYQEVLDVFLDYGITSIKDVCSRLDEVLKLRQDVASGLLKGPRVFAVGPAFTAPDGHPAKTLWPDDPEMVAAALRMPEDPDTARAQVRELVAAGVDQIKCVMTDCSGSCARMEPAILTAIVDEAHRHGLRAVVHTDSNQDVSDALSAGADGLEHGFVAEAPDPQLAAQLAVEGTFVTTTIAASTLYNPLGYQGMVDGVSLLREAGVRVVAGSDADNAVPFGLSFHNELRYLTDAGYTPLETLIAATRLAAVHVEREADLGTIEPGKLADLIALARDPLADITAAGEVALVIKNGEILRQ